MNVAKEWINSLNLSPHPEGGWFREVYRSEETISETGLPGRFNGNRAFSTAIYFLLKETDFSALHRIQQDEVWHFYDGSALTIHMIDLDADYSTVTLGRDVQKGERPLAIVPAGYLFGATVNDVKSYSLVGCTVAPGFDFADFEMPERGRLLEQLPQHQFIIKRLTRSK